MGDHDLITYHTLSIGKAKKVIDAFSIVKHTRNQVYIPPWSITQLYVIGGALIDEMCTKPKDYDQFFHLKIIEDLTSMSGPLPTKFYCSPD